MESDGLGNSSINSSYDFEAAIFSIFDDFANIEFWSAVAESVLLPTNLVISAIKEPDVKGFFNSL